MTHDPSSCFTCGSPVAPATSEWDNDGEAAATPFCSIHCEHYFGLQRASERAAQAN